MKKWTRFLVTFIFLLNGKTALAQEENQSEKGVEKIIKRVNKKVEKYRKILDGDFFYPYTINGSTYKLHQNIITQDCRLAFSLTVRDQDGNLLPEFQREASFPLTMVESIEKLSKQESQPVKDKTFGYTLRFLPQDKILSFPTSSKREKFFNDLTVLQDYCHQLARLQKEKDLQTLGQTCQEQESGTKAPLPSEQGIKISDAFSLGNRFLHKAADGDKDMEVAVLSQKESFAERYRTALEAKESIFVQTLIHMGDSSGRALAELLIQKKQEGIDVQILVDFLSPMFDFRRPRIRENTYIMYNNMMAAGIPVHGYSCSSGFYHFLQEWKKSYKMGDFSNYRLSFHDKIWQVDKKTSIMGGLNIEDHYFGLGPDGPTKWLDQDVMVKGKSLNDDITNIFQGTLKSYQDNRVQPFNKKCLNPHPVGTEAYNDFYLKHRKDYVRPFVMAKHQDKRTAIDNEIEELKKGLVDGRPYQLEFHKIPEARLVQSRPDINETYIEDNYIDLINKAEKEIWIVNGYFIPTVKFRQALIKAEERGVQINILTNSEEGNLELTPMVLAGRYYDKEIVEPALELPNKPNIFLWTGVDENEALKTGERKIARGMVHAKFAVFDRKVSLVSSFNISADSRGYTGERPDVIHGNSEIALLFENPEAARKLVEKIENQELKFAKKMDYTTMLKYRKPRGVRNLKKKLLLKLSRKFEHQL